MLTRRTFGTSTALAATLAAFPALKDAAAKADAPANKKDGSLAVDPRGDVGRLRRMPTLEQESRIDFLAGMSVFYGGDLMRAKMKRGNELAVKAGLDPAKPISDDDAIALFGNDPVVNLHNAVQQYAHNYTNDVTYAAFHSNGDAYLAEMEAHDNIGPGSLTLNPNMAVPDYTRHEIHQQTGGYVGDPFAGHMYHADATQFYHGQDDQDQLHAGYAAESAVPADEKVARVLDLGTGIGQLAVAMKERFPEAEVHGVDIGAPMVRYAHMRAVNLGADVHFKQALAEDTGYPDNHFDIVIDYIMFHEVSAEATAKILKEAYRVLRPGGVFQHIDFNYNQVVTPIKSYMNWFARRWNNERWSEEYRAMDFHGAMRDAGFAVEDKSEFNGVFSNIVGTKTA